MVEQIEREDILGAMLDALKAKEDASAMTSEEIAEALGISKKKALGLLGLLKQNGKIEVVREYRQALDDRYLSVPAYRLKTT